MTQIALKSLFNKEDSYVQKHAKLLKFIWAVLRPFAKNDSRKIGKL